MPRPSPPGFSQKYPRSAVNYAALPGRASTTPPPRRYAEGQGLSASSAGDIKVSAAAGAQFIDALQMIFRLVNIGDAKSFASHPAPIHHRQRFPGKNWPGLAYPRISCAFGRH